MWTARGQVYSSGQPGYWPGGLTTNWEQLIVARLAFTWQKRYVERPSMKISLPCRSLRPMFPKSLAYLFSGPSHVTHVSANRSPRLISDMLQRGLRRVGHISRSPSPHSRSPGPPDGIGIFAMTKPPGEDTKAFSAMPGMAGKLYVLKENTTRLSPVSGIRMVIVRIAEEWAIWVMSCCV